MWWSGPRPLTPFHRQGLDALNGQAGSAAALSRARIEAVLKVRASADIRRARAEGKIGLIYGFQNAAIPGRDATRVDIFDDLGVRIIQLTCNPANALGDGSTAPLNRGLTPFGREVVARLHARRVMLDLSHRGPRQFHKLARLLAGKGYSSRRVEKMLGLNFVEYAERVWGQ
ncbi:membrane dipeptidase [Frateuria aurantia]